MSEPVQPTFNSGAAPLESDAPFAAAESTLQSRAFRLIVEGSPHGIVIVDEAGRVMLVNAATERLFGYTRDELLGQDIGRLIPIHLRAAHEASVHDFARHPASRSVHARGPLQAAKKDGTLFPVEIALTPLRTLTGLVTLATITDVTELRRSERKFQLLFEKSPDAHLILDAEGIRECNAAAVSLLGTPDRSALIGLSPSTLSPPRQPDGSSSTGKWQEWDALGQSKGDVCFEWTFQRSDKTLVPCAVALTMVELPAGAALLAVCHDLTEIKNVTAALRLRNEEMQQLLYVVSHDLHNPLVTIRGFSRLLASQVEHQQFEKAQESVERIERGVRTMSRLIDDILLLSRTSSGELQWEQVEVPSVLREVLAALDAQIQQAQATVEISNAPPAVYADRGQLLQALLNLISNALKYGMTPQCRTLFVGGEQTESSIRLFVRDRGPGIAPENHRKIFQLFQRLHHDSEGTGLGLTTVAKIMERHRGSAWVESTPGKGATFYLEFPQHRPISPTDIHAPFHRP